MTSGSASAIRRALVATTIASAFGCHHAPKTQWWQFDEKHGPVSRFAAPAFRADSTATKAIGTGLTLRTYVRRSGPTIVHVLDVDLIQCWTLAAVKAGDRAIGRGTTTALTTSFARFGAVAGINADFFLFNPPGVPQGLTIANGPMYTGSNGVRPLFALSRQNMPMIGYASTVIDVVAADKTRQRVSWNVFSNDSTKPSSTIFDARWGEVIPALNDAHATLFTPVDSTKSIAGMQLLNRTVNVKATALDRDTSYVLSRNAWLWLTQGHGASAPRVADMTTLVPQFRFSRTPFINDTATVGDKEMPREAVGGQPILLRDSVITNDVQTVGSESFRGLNPRTAIGMSEKGRRLFLVVIDGRQPGVSMGATLGETADIMRELGARDAINLDGGGSTAMAMLDGVNTYKLVNTPSDSSGERPVADALVVIPRCTTLRAYRQ